MQTYDVEIKLPVYEQIIEITKYIKNILIAPDAAQKRKNQILSDIRQLENFPERGFDADQKIGTKLLPNHKTFGLPIVNGKYILLYYIHEKTVTVIDLLPTQSDYAKLFLS
ncbi:type II toxin-antitoxin system RelE/ParE family toxin [Lactococcus nasutitermitis]|uniref:Type II toxin-antitoxin system RelE/ParE family toxin n=1 Tax=Lactococcus nasutitermitis TaxID=1652957 RepID=A0ABV9JFT6_9LACT|nr:type II toxin-antitoxin system RelE/ParE family toxin [Lactococcus nasutitermitis]